MNAYIIQKKFDAVISKLFKFSKVKGERAKNKFRIPIVSKGNGGMGYFLRTGAGNSGSKFEALPTVYMEVSGDK